jgi:hypothetical protein
VSVYLPGQANTRRTTPGQLQWWHGTDCNIEVTFYLSLCACHEDDNSQFERPYEHSGYQQPGHNYFQDYDCSCDYNEGWRQDHHREQPDLPNELLAIG